MEMNPYMVALAIEILAKSPKSKYIYKGKEYKNIDFYLELKKDHLIFESHDYEKISHLIWNVSVEDFSTSIIDGKTIGINFYFFSFLKLYWQLNELQKAVENNTKINVTETTHNLFITIIMIIAGRARFLRKNESDFDDVVKKIIFDFHEAIIPFTKSIDNGNRLNKLENVFTGKQIWINNWINESMSPIFEFLNNEKLIGGGTIIPISEKSGKKGCFIATAVFDDYDSPEVLKLRIFRDKQLSKYFLGRKFIHLYYRYSPSIANGIKNKPIIKYLLKRILQLFV